MKLGIDVDGVLADFVTPHAALVEALGSTGAAWCAIKDAVAWWEGLTPYPGVEAALRRLRPADEVYILTRRFGEGVQAQTARWLMALWPEGTPAVLIVPYDRDKGALAKMLTLDAVIDDTDAVAAAVRSRAPKCKMFLVDRPWNRDAVRRTRVERVKDFSAALDRLGIPDIKS